MKKTIIVFAMLSLLTGAAHAISFPGPDSIGIYATLTDTVTTLTTTAGFQQFEVYMMITNPSLEGVSGWECKVNVDGPVVAGAWTLAAGTDYNADPELFTVGIGIGVNAIRTDTETNSCAIASYAGYIMNITDQVTFTIRPFPGSVTFHPGPGYVAPDDAGIIQDLVMSTGGYLDGATWVENPAFVINQALAPIANEDVTWAGVKTLFR